MAYYFQTSSLWRKTLLFSSYIYMYMILLSFTSPPLFQFCVEITILFMFCFDLALQTVYRCKSKFSIPTSSPRYIFKSGIVFLLIIDEILSTQSILGYPRLCCLLRCGTSGHIFQSCHSSTMPN